MNRQQYAATITAKARLVDSTKFQNSKTSIPHFKSEIYQRPNRRPNICTTERYIQQQLQKPKVVQGKNAYFGTFRKGRRILVISDIHFRRVKREQLQNLFNNVKSIVGYFSGAKTQDLHHYIIP